MMVLHGTTCNNDFSRNNAGNTLRIFDLGSGKNWQRFTESKMLREN